MAPKSRKRAKSAPPAPVTDFGQLSRRERRIQAVTLVVCGDFSYKDTAKLLGIDRDTVSLAVKRFHDGHGFDDAPHSGRKRKFDAVTNEALDDTLHNDRDKSLRSVTRELQDQGMEVSYRTVQRAANSIGLRYRQEKEKPLINDTQAARRYEFTRRHCNDSTATVTQYVFLDEKYFYAGCTPRGVWLYDDEPDPITGTGQYPANAFASVSTLLTRVCRAPSPCRSCPAFSLRWPVKYPSTVYVMGGMCELGLLDPFFPPKGVKTDSSGYIEFLEHIKGCAHRLYGSYNFTIIHVRLHCFPPHPQRVQ
jgi:transposase